MTQSISDGTSVGRVSDEDLRTLVEKTPPSGKHRGIVLLTAVATLGSLLYGYDTGVISGALPYMYMPHGAGGLMLTSLEEGAVGGTLLIGAAAGSLFGGMLSDRYGRRHNILMLAVIFLVGALGTAFSPTVQVMYIFRLILGVAVGGASATVPVFLAETAPKRLRGTIIAVDQVMVVSGQLLAFSMNAMINHANGGPHLTIKNDPSGHFAPGSYSFDQIKALQSGVSPTGTMNAAQFHDFMAQLSITAGNGGTWRLMLVLCSIPAVALWIGIRMMPESSRWYLVKGRVEECIGSLKRIRVPEKDGPIADEVAEMMAVRNQELAEEGHRIGLGEILRTKWLRNLLLFGFLLAFSNQVTGVNTVMYYAPKVLEYAGMGTSASITAQVANGVMAVIGAVTGLWLIRRFRRRQIFIVANVMIGILLLVISLVFQTVISQHLAHGTVAPSWAAYLVLACMGVFMLTMQAGNAPVMMTLMGEAFPSGARGLMEGMSVCMMWVLNAIITWTFPAMMAGLGGARTYLMYGVLNLLVAGVLIKVMPETSGKSLEEIEVMMERHFS